MQCIPRSQMSLPCQIFCAAMCWVGKGKGFSITGADNEHTLPKLRNSVVCCIQCGNARTIVCAVCCIYGCKPRMNKLNTFILAPKAEALNVLKQERLGPRLRQYA